MQMWCRFSLSTVVKSLCNEVYVPCHGREAVQERHCKETIHRILRETIFSFPLLQLCKILDKRK